MKKWLGKTWKDEATAFFLLVLALIFFMKMARFFSASQVDRAPQLEAYQPRQRERVVEYVDRGESPYWWVATSAVVMNSFIMTTSGLAVQNMTGNASTIRVMYQEGR